VQAKPVHSETAPRQGCFSIDSTGPGARCVSRAGGARLPHKFALRNSPPLHAHTAYSAASAGAASLSAEESADDSVLSPSRDSERRPSRPLPKLRAGGASAEKHTTSAVTLSPLCISSDMSTCAPGGRQSRFEDYSCHTPCCSSVGNNSQLDRPWYLCSSAAQRASETQMTMLDYHSYILS